MISECNDLVIVLSEFHSSLPKVVLTVHNVELTDQGMYKCTVRTSKGHSLPGKITLNIKGRAELLAHIEKCSSQA